MKFKIHAQPISTNRIWIQSYKTKHTYLNPKYNYFRKIAKLDIEGRKLPSDWEFCAVKIVVHPLRKTGDADNYIKCVLDSLTYAGFWEDDKCVAEVSCRFGEIEQVTVVTNGERSRERVASVDVEIERRFEKFGKLKRKDIPWNYKLANLISVGATEILRYAQALQDEKKSDIYPSLLDDLTILVKALESSKNLSPEINFVIDDYIDNTDFEAVQDYTWTEEDEQNRLKWIKQ